MPYYRRRSFRKRFTRRKSTPWYNRKYSAVQLASKAVAGVRYLKGLVNSELFKHDIQTSFTVGWGGTMVPLASIANGDGDGQRTGNSIFVRNVTVRGTAYLHASASTTNVRVMVLIDKQQIGDTAPTAADVLDTTGTAFAPISLLNDATVGRFTVLKSRRFILNSVSRPNTPFQFNLRMRHHVRYNGTTSSDIQRGGLYLLLISDQVTNVPVVERQIRVSYHDN